MPKIVSPNTMPALTTEVGAHHYRFVGIEITTTHAASHERHQPRPRRAATPDGNPPPRSPQLPHRHHVRSLLHPRHPDGQRPPRHRAEQRRARPSSTPTSPTSTRSAPTRRRSAAGTARALQDRQQLPGGGGRERHVRRRRPARSRTSCPPTSRSATTTSSSRCRWRAERPELRRHPLVGQEPVRAEERPARARRRQHLREQLGGRPERLSPSCSPSATRTAPPPGRVVAGRDLHQQHHAPRRRRPEHPRLRRQPPEPADAPADPDHRTTSSRT